MARLGLLLCVLVILLAACGSQAGARASCSAASGSRVLASNAQVIVYSSHGAVYGCSHASGRVTRLGTSTSCVRSTLVAAVAVAGGLVAYGAESCLVDTGSSVVVVRRLSDGKVLRKLPAISQMLGPESYDRVESVVVLPSGSVAWIVSGGSIVRHASTTEVDANRGAATSRLDSGSAIRGRSLRLRGTRLSWTHGSATRTATL